MGWLSQLIVAYGDNESEKPGNAIQVVNGASGDINNGFGGKFVWIVATFNSNQERAFSEISIDIQDNEDGSRSDLANGAGGKFRYLSWRRDSGPKITDLQLLRSGDQVVWETVQGHGFNGWSGDINAGRGGDFLHLVWRT